MWWADMNLTANLEICWCGTGNQWYSPAAVLAHPQPVVLQPHEDFLPDFWVPLMDWSLVIRINPVINIWPLIKRFSISVFYLGLLSCEESMLQYFPLYFLLSLLALITDWESSCHLQLLLSCTFTVYPASKPPSPTWWSQWRKSMLVTGRLLKLKLTTLGKISDNLVVGVVVFKSSGLLFANASLSCLVFSECLIVRRVWLFCLPSYWCW